MAAGQPPDIPDHTLTGLQAGFALAKRTHGLSEQEVRRAYRRSKPWRSKLLLSEFMLFRLYDPDRDPRHFIGSYEAAKVAYALNRYSPTRRIIGNKLHWDATLKGLGYEVPELQAVYGMAAGPHVPQLVDRDATRRFLRYRAKYPLFCKPARGQASAFVMALDGFDAENQMLIDWRGQEIESWHLLRPLENRFRHTGFLFQSAVTQHPDVEKTIGRAVGCLRYVTFKSEAGVELIGVAWKVPNAGAISDAGGLGGLAVSLDQKTGEVERVFSSSDAGAVEIEHHPGTGARMVGFRIPNWDKMMEQVLSAAAVLHHLPLVGWDIAIGPDGAIFVEANSSPSFWAMQIGRDKGLYTPELQARFAKEQGRQKQLYGPRVGRKARLKRNLGLLWGRVGEIFGR